METNNITPASRLVYWSAEDNCFIGSLPDICGNCCHADNEEDVHRQLDVIAQEWSEIETKQANRAFDKLTANSSPQEIALKDYLQRGIPLNSPKNM
ncbi:MAG: hypothetical protein IKZ10_06570 [Akkermansia sp.]|nr:hypothetical protein [Akkermansia sp.]